MKIKKRLLISIIILIVLVLAFYYITSQVTQTTGFLVSDISMQTKTELCLISREIILFVNSENPNLRDIKAFEYLNNVRIINCFYNNDLCKLNQINVFPTWMINDKKIEGDVSIDKLKEISGCE